MRNRYKKFSLITIGLALAAFVINTVAATPADEAPTPEAPELTYLYKTAFLRAAPGKLLDLISLYKARMDVIKASGDEPPMWWRHTQGDQWDFMMLFPMGSYEEYYSKARAAKRPKDDFARKLEACVSWREDLFVYGPPLEKVKKLFNDAAYYHVEIFIALPGKQEELLKERVMENIYQVETGRPENMIFVRDQGASWDLFTLGCYRDILHWADRTGITAEQREAAARKAGFESPDAIGPYMRTLIDFHRDTMGVAIR